MPTWLHHTPRMRWRALAMATDQAVIYRQFADPDMCAYYDEPPCTLAEAQDIITHYANATEVSRYRRYLMVDAVADVFIGTCGFHYLNTTERSVEIGYDIWKEYWRQGYAREMLSQLLQICFAISEIDLVYAVILKDNAASIAVVVGAGFTTINPPARIADTPHIVLGITRATYSILSPAGITS